MDNLNTHSEHVDQPQGQQENGSPFPVPTSQVFDDHMIEQQHTNLPPFGFYPEQPRMQIDQVLQFCSEQARVSQQQQMAIHNLNVLNFLRANALIQKNQEIASLRRELQRKEDDMDQLLQRLAATAYEMNGPLVCMVPPVQQETNPHGSSNEFDAPGSGDEATSKVRTPAGATKADLVCDVCNSCCAGMVFLPCKHLCACTPCGAHLTACPVCGAVKVGVIEPRFGGELKKE